MNLKEKPQTRQKYRIFYFLTPSIAGIIFISVFLTQTFSIANGLLKDCDTGYHIRAGEYILNNLSIPKQDMFSFISPPLAWTAHEWLSEVIMAAIHKLSGLTGIVFFFSFLISIVYYSLFKKLQSLKGNIIIAAIVIIFVIASSQIHWLARPHIFSMLFIIIWYYLLDAFQYNNQKNALYFQIPLMLLWVNMHAGFITGFMLNGIYLLKNISDLLWSTESNRSIYKKKAFILGLITIACLSVSLVNPYHYQILLFPFKLIKEKFIVDNIGEFLSPNFHKLSVFPFELFLLLTLAIFSFSKERLNIAELSLTIFFLHMALLSARYIPLFCIITAPIVTKQVDQILEYSKGKLPDFIRKKAAYFSEIDSSTNDFVWPAAVFLIAVFFATFGQLKHDFHSEKKPIAASKFIEQEYIKGNMFNKDEFGDYIIYRNYPAYKVFIDGRIDMYGVEKLKEYYRIIKFEHGWEEILEKYNITWIFYDSNSALSRYLLQNKDWRLIYSDKVVSIFLKNISENQRLIQKYKNVKSFIHGHG